MHGHVAAIIPALLVGASNLINNAEPESAKITEDSFGAGILTAWYWITLSAKTCAEYCAVLEPLRDKLILYVPLSSSSTSRLKFLVWEVLLEVNDRVDGENEYNTELTLTPFDRTSIGVMMMLSCGNDESFTVKMLFDNAPLVYNDGLLYRKLGNKLYDISLQQRVVNTLFVFFVATVEETSRESVCTTQKLP